MRSNRLIRAAALAVACFATVASLATAQANVPAKETLTFSAARVESVLAKGRERTLLTGKAKVVSGDLEIRADVIEITGEKYSFISCKGSVEVSDSVKGFKLKTDRLTYDRQTEMTSTEGSSALEDTENGIQLSAFTIEFDVKNEKIVARIGVRIIREDFAARSEYAMFDRKENSLVLTGTPRVASDGAAVSATSVTARPGTDELELTGEVSGSIVTEPAAETAPESNGQ